MSATTPQTETYTCEHCGGPRKISTSVGGSFCSEHCLFRHRGEKALRQIITDHRWCATCFRQIKTTHRPSEDDLKAMDVPRHIRDAFIGYQDVTEHATDGVDVTDAVEGSSRRIEYTRTSCSCGAVDPCDRHEVLRQLDPAETIQSLWTCLNRLERDGTLQRRPSQTPYLEALRESNRDWVYAIGRALYSE